MEVRQAGSEWEACELKQISISDPDRQALAKDQLAAMKAMLGKDHVAQYRGHFEANINGKDVLHIATR